MRRLLDNEYDYKDGKLLRLISMTDNESELNDPLKYIEMKIGTNQSSIIPELLEFPEYIAGLTAIITNIGLIGFKDSNNKIISVYDIITADNLTNDLLDPDYFGTMAAYTEENNPFARRIVNWCCTGTVGDGKLYTYFLPNFSIIEKWSNNSSIKKRKIIIDADNITIKKKNINAHTWDDVNITVESSDGIFEYTYSSSQKNYEITSIKYNYKPAYLIRSSRNILNCISGGEIYDFVDDNGIYNYNIIMNTDTLLTIDISDLKLTSEECGILEVY